MCKIATLVSIVAIELSTLLTSSLEVHVVLMARAPIEASFMIIRPIITTLISLVVEVLVITFSVTLTTMPLVLVILVVAVHAALTVAALVLLVDRL